MAAILPDAGLPVERNSRFGTAVNRPKTKPLLNSGCRSVVKLL
jgi:hypothetical protein